MHHSTTKWTRLFVFFAVILIAGSAFAQITITHEPLRQFHSDTDNGFPIKAKITSTAGTINIRRVWWAKNGTSYQLLFMQPTGRPNEFAATIPKQNRNTTIRYYILAGDTAGNAVNEPAGAPGQGDTSFVFYIGHYKTLYFDDFEGGDTGWVSGFTLGEDDWEFSDPNVGGQGQTDPLTAWSGLNVRGNDLDGSSNQAGKYPANTVNFIDSPSIDCTTSRFVHLFYRRWLNVEEGIYDDSILSVNGGIAWRNQENGDSLDTEWKAEYLNISSWASMQASVILRFEMQSDAGLEYGGWTIDDVHVTERLIDWVTMSFNNINPSIGETIVLTVNANPNTAWYMLDAREQGNGQFQVPGGPLVYSGLHGNSTRNRLSGMTDGSGVAMSNLRVPNRTNLIGLERWISTVGFASGWIDSNLVKLTVMP